MRDSIIEKLYNYKLNGDLTEEGYETATTILQILNQKHLAHDNYFLYQEDNIVLEIHKQNYNIFIDFKDTIDICTVDQINYHSRTDDFDQLDAMYEHLI